MTDQQDLDDLDWMGPVDYIIVEFPGSKMTGEGLPLLVDLVDRGIIRILDLVFVTKELDGSVTGIAVADLDNDGILDLAVFEGASSGLLGEDDIAEAGGVLEPGSSAGILVYENVWAAPFAREIRRGGGTARRQWTHSLFRPCSASRRDQEDSESAAAESNSDRDMGAVPEPSGAARRKEAGTTPGLIRGVARTA